MGPESTGAWLGASGPGSLVELQQGCQLGPPPHSGNSRRRRRVQVLMSCWTGSCASSLAVGQRPPSVPRHPSLSTGQLTTWHLAPLRWKPQSLCDLTSDSISYQLYRISVIRSKSLYTASAQQDGTEGMNTGCRVH